MEYNLFGEPIEERVLLRDKYIEPPFTVLNARNPHWLNRKRKWINLGIQSEVSREDVETYHNTYQDYMNQKNGGNKVSIFDPVLCELMYTWFCPMGGGILDPFSGGSVRGIVANYLGYHYTGIDIRQEQVDSNREQAMNILPINNQPQWYCGDSNAVLDNEWRMQFDMMFTCPPYGDLETYSDIEGDISNMPHDDFMRSYRRIIRKSCALLKPGAYAAIVVGEYRDKKGDYVGFVPETFNAFVDCGMKFYNEAILQTPIGTAMLRADNNMRNKKLVKTHQNVLIFRKP